MANETPVLSEKEKEALIYLGMEARVKNAAKNMDAVMAHFKTQLTIASGMYNYLRFKSDLETLRHALDDFENAMLFKEQMSGKVGSTPRSDQAREQREGPVLAVAAAGEDGQGVRPVRGSEPVLGGDAAGQPDDVSGRS